MTRAPREGTAGEVAQKCAEVETADSIIYYDTNDNPFFRSLKYFFPISVPRDTMVAMNRRMSFTLPQVFEIIATALTVILIVIANIEVLTHVDIAAIDPSDRFYAVWLPVVVDVVFVTLLIFSCIEYHKPTLSILKPSMLTLAISCETIASAFFDFDEDEQMYTIAAVLYLFAALLGIFVSICSVIVNHYFSTRQPASLSATRIIYALAFALALQGTRIYGDKVLNFNYIGLLFSAVLWALTEVEAQKHSARNNTRDAKVMLAVGTVLIILSLFGFLAICITQITPRWGYPLITSALACLGLSPAISSVGLITLATYKLSKATTSLPKQPVTAQAAVPEATTQRPVPNPMPSPTPASAFKVLDDNKIQRSPSNQAITQVVEPVQPHRPVHTDYKERVIARSNSDAGGIKLSVLITACVVALILGLVIGGGLGYKNMADQKLASANTALGQKQRKVNKLNAQIDALSDKLSTAKNTIDKADKLDSSIDDLTKKQKDLTKKRDDLQNKVNQLTQQYDQQKGQPIQLPAGKFTVGKEVPAGRYIIKGSSNFITRLGDEVDINTILGSDGFGDYHGDLLDGESIENDAPSTLVPVQ